MLVIFDTSVLISVFISSGKSYASDIIELAYNNKLTIISSIETFKELQDSIRKDKIKKFKSYNSRKMGIFIAWFKYNTLKTSINPNQKLSITSRDVKDSIFLLLAGTSNAHYLITVDRDLLDLKKVGNTYIISPEEFIHKESKKFGL